MVSYQLNLTTIYRHGTRKKLSDKYGDAGDVAFEAKKRQSLTLRKPKPLTIKAVFDSLVKISMAKGHGSVETKQRLVERLVQDSRGAEESRYVVRTLVQHVSSSNLIMNMISDTRPASYRCRQNDYANSLISSFLVIKAA
jgi:ATP-dependent DNA ligase